MTALERDRQRRPRKTARRLWTGLSREGLGPAEYFRRWKAKRRAERGLSQDGRAIFNTGIVLRWNGKKMLETPILHRTQGWISTAFGTFYEKNGAWRWVVDRYITLKFLTGQARKSSHHKCPICGRWCRKNGLCPKAWSDGDGGWEHD